VTQRGKDGPDRERQDALARRIRANLAERDRRAERKKAQLHRRFLEQRIGAEAREPTDKDLEWARAKTEAELQSKSLREWAPDNPPGWLELRWDGEFRAEDHLHRQFFDNLLDAPIDEEECLGAKPLALRESGLFRLERYGGRRFSIAPAFVPPLESVADHIEKSRSRDPDIRARDHFDAARLIMDEYCRYDSYEGAKTFPVRWRGGERSFFGSDFVSCMFNERNERDWIERVYRGDIAPPPHRRARRDEKFMMRDRRVAEFANAIRGGTLATWPNPESLRGTTVVEIVAKASGLSWKTVKGILQTNAALISTTRR